MEEEEEIEEEVQYESLYDDNDEPDLSVVLALLLRSGQVRLSQGVINRFGEGSDEDDEDASENQAGLEEPDTIKESDLTQDVLLHTGRLANTKANSKESIVKSVWKRELSCCGAKRKNVFTAGCQTAICSHQIPNTVVNSVSLREKVFCGIYSEDGNTFLSACQDSHLRVYDANRFDDVSQTCKPFKNIPALDIGWSILDVAFSPDALYLAYTTWSSVLHIASIYDNEDVNLSSHHAMDLRPENYNFAAFSLQFSADNNEVLCGGNDGHLYIYDRNRNSRTSRIYAHEDDINAIRFADKGSQILYSGGDDGLVNVWDRRMLHENSPQKVGSFAGHVDGITFIDSKDDSRYLLSNSKDQTIKVWDVRKFSSAGAQEAVKVAVARQAWDYRWQQVPRRQRNRKKTVAGDTSIKTYHGHEVTNTLIRARFSPMHTTGQRYIYTGCSKGNVVIYDILTGEIVSKIKRHKHCVRDVSWHPYEPKLVSTSWDGTFSVWSHETEAGDVEMDISKPSRKRRLGGKDCDEEDGHSYGLRRSPRLARANYTST
ncbi:DDB1- and CUL4-associated factor 11-like [Styela clava]